MSEKDAKQMILMAILLTGLTAAGKEVIQGKTPGGRIFFGLIIAGFLLSILAEVAPEVAGPLAALLMVTAMFGKEGGADNMVKILKKVGKI